MYYQIHSIVDMSTDKKEHIINTAIELFAVKGFEGTSIREIAAAAQVNLAMINYYFGSKEKLFESIVEYKASHSRGALEEVAADTSLTQMQKIEVIIQRHVDRLFANRHFHRVIFQEMVMTSRSALQESIICKIIYPNNQIITQIIQSGIDSGEFNRNADPQLCTVTIIGTINQIMSSKRFCNKMLNRDDDETYVPYEDDAFKQRFTNHMISIMQNHLLKQS
ncbi:TetR/AcrR family transcriptional regulator [Filimonas effusa]|uniref:TetR/AcrR family transcriptional regulator n=1 Tax=Filimonas effusa TaxID=2508721 RepID=A0A4Q1D962_9BACT|nr:TetR family transcriptional regulator [Filimonas effusa]RXK85358.1 TetR/AcrR family transcriptional regulator [Filimonas effusa]